MISVFILARSRRNNIPDIVEQLKTVFINQWEKIFIVDALKNDSISYKKFLAMVLACRNRLQTLPLKRGSFICVCLPNSIEVLVTYIAALLLGLVVVPVDPLKGKAEIREISAQIPFDLFICESRWSDFHTKGFKILSGSEIKQAIVRLDSIDDSAVNVFDRANSNDLFLITFTTGSTGTPKGVMHSLGNLIRSAQAFNIHFKFDHNSVFYHNLPMTYMAGILNLFFLPLISGSQIVVGERFNISRMLNFWEIPAKYSVNTFWFIPTILALLLKLDRGNEGVTYCQNRQIIGCVGTAPLPFSVKKKFEERYGILLYESYGLSELLFITTNHPHEEQKKYSVGRPLKDVYLKIGLDMQILVQVPWLFLGYVNIRGRDLLKNGFYATGDLGVLDNQGFLKITGRKKDIIIKGGMNISPQKIESIIQQGNVLDEFVVLGVKDLVLGEKIVCFYVVGKQPFDHERQNHINIVLEKSLGKDACIDEFFKLAEIPRHSNGKINKIKIKQLYKQE